MPLARTGDTAVYYKATTSPTWTTIATDIGSLTADNGVFTIKSADGTVLAGLLATIDHGEHTFVPVIMEVPTLTVDTSNGSRSATGSAASNSSRSVAHSDPVT